MTATDVAALCGVYFGRSPVDVLEEKRGIDTGKKETVRMQIGTLVEAPLREWFATTRNLVIDVPGTLQHRDEPWMMATPDGLIRASSGRGYEEGLEIKDTIYQVWHRGEPLLPRWRIQATWNLAVARSHWPNIERWNLLVSVCGVPEIVPVLWNEDFAADLYEVAKDFYERHMLGGEPLSPDGSESYGSYLKRRFVRSNKDLRLATAEELAEVAGLKAAIAAAKRAEQELERQKQVVQELIGDSAGLLIPVGDHQDRITWRTDKLGRRVFRTPSSWSEK